MEYIIVGGGLAGIAAARELQRHKKDFRLLEAAPCLGGRVGSELLDGFVLDHGFQILLDNYPELISSLDIFNAHKVLGLVCPPPGKGCTTLYFEARNSPVNEPVLILNSDNSGLLNHLAVMSDVSSSKAPAF